MAVSSVQLEIDYMHKSKLQMGRTEQLNYVR